MVEMYMHKENRRNTFYVYFEIHRKYHSLFPFPLIPRHNGRCILKEFDALNMQPFPVKQPIFSACLPSDNPSPKLTCLRSLASIIKVCNAMSALCDCTAPLRHHFVKTENPNHLIITSCAGRVPLLPLLPPYSMSPMSGLPNI